MEKNYCFGLFSEEGLLIDSINLDENDKEFALDLLLNEYGHDFKNDRGDYGKISIKPITNTDDYEKYLDDDDEDDEDYDDFEDEDDFEDDDYELDEIKEDDHFTF